MARQQKYGLTAAEWMSPTWKERVSQVGADVQQRSSRHAVAAAVAGDIAKTQPKPGDVRPRERHPCLLSSRPKFGNKDG